MVKRFIIIILILVASTSSSFSECKYYAEADVVNDELINKKEHYTCPEKDNFFIQFMTEEKYQNAFILVLLIVGLMLSNCTNSYVKNKKTITSPDDLMKFTNVWCEKQKQTNNVIKMCGQGWSKDLNISESKAIIDAKLKIADITQHSIIKSEKIVKKENSKGISQSYELNADNTLNEATIVGYKIVSKKVMKEKNGWRTMVLLEYKIS